MGNALIDRLFCAVLHNRHLDRLAMRAVVKANELLGLALGGRLARLRDSGDPLERAFAEVEANALYARLMAERAEILAERWDRIPEKRRPHYRPPQRFRILRVRQLLALSRDETARFFRVAPSTIARWEQAATSEARSLDEVKTVSPQPPVRRYADVVRELVRSMALLGFGGSKTIAQTLARAGWRLSERTVSRIVREKPISAPSSEPALSAPGFQPRFPHHAFLIDLTELSSLFGLFRFKIAVVLDAFSRMPLAAAAFGSDPSAPQMASLLEAARRRFGPAQLLITDQGPQFTAAYFRKVASRLGIRQRFGAVGKSGSIALIERFWRTLKHVLRRGRVPPLTKQALEQRLATALVYYAYFRPHQGLGGATPAEIYFEWEPAHRQAAPPPRARPREGPAEHPFTISFLDDQRRLPILFRNAA